jgi:type 1 glutamine amidotransferase
LYLVSPIDKSAQILLVGSKEGNEQEPVAWTRQFGQSRVFYTSLGAPADFQMPVFQRLLNNAVTWALKK